MDGHLCEGLLFTGLLLSAILVTSRTLFSVVMGLGVEREECYREGFDLERATIYSANT